MNKQVFFCLMVLPFLMIVSACSGFGERGGGVARADDVGVVVSEKTVTSDSNQATESTDEQIAIQFVECMRVHGFNVIDPVLHADGTINWEPIKGSLGQLDKKNVKLRKAYDECLPLLEKVTVSKGPEKEDPTELKENLLHFAECLRDKGLNVPDPDFTDETKRGYKEFLAGLNTSNPKVQRSLDECQGVVFGTTASEKDEK